MSDKVIHANFGEQEPIEVRLVLRVHPRQLQNKYFMPLNYALAEQIADEACKCCPDLRLKDIDWYGNMIEIGFCD